MKLELKSGVEDEVMEWGDLRKDESLSFSSEVSLLGSTLLHVSMSSGDYNS